MLTEKHNTGKNIRKDMKDSKREVILAVKFAELVLNVLRTLNTLQALFKRA